MADEHWVDRSGFLKVEQSAERTKDAAKVVLLSLDRNRAYYFPPTVRQAGTV